MAKSDGQGDPAPGPSSRERGESTRAALFGAAAELIAEEGWGKVTTRAIAERAGVPHGAVGYHFRGREELLREAAIGALAEMLAIPVALASQAKSVTELLRGTLDWYTSGGLRHHTVALLMEALREADRDEAVREPLAAMLREYRLALAGLIRRDQARGALRSDADPEGLAMAISAMLDGLVAHARLDPDLDLAAAGRVMLGLLSEP
jgi:AcrR family transcriptional regulator